MDHDRIIREFLFDHAGHKCSQLGQDLAVMALTGKKTHGYFVEFGVMDGHHFSNTWLLERDLGWHGIVAEAALCFRVPLAANRSCHIDHRAVTDRTGDRLQFKETNIELGLSGLTDYFPPQEMHTSRRAASAGKTYTVETVSLNDLLSHHDAPQHIDYVSIDTEGSEYIILQAFDFARWHVDFFTIEHNYVEPRRTEIRELMAAHGYQLIDPALSGHDDWFVKV